MIARRRQALLVVTSVIATWILIRNSMWRTPGKFMKVQYSQEHQREEEQIRNNYSIKDKDTREVKTQSEDDEGGLRQKLRRWKILCWVPVAAKSHNTSAKVVLETWGPRCDRLIFMSSLDDPSINAVNLGVAETYGNLWLKTRAALLYLYQHHLHEYDWFMKADDDTYVVVENLRYLLGGRDPREPQILGCRYWTGIHRYGYMTGGGGYAMSRSAVQVFVERALPSRAKCPIAFPKKDKPCEDVALALCLGQQGVTFVDTRDEEGRERFFQSSLLAALSSGPAKRLFNKFKSRGCCSPTAVTFHNLNRQDMYLLDYALYTWRPYGLVQKVQFPPPPPPSVQASSTRAKPVEENV